MKEKEMNNLDSAIDKLENLINVLNLPTIPDLIHVQALREELPDLLDMLNREKESQYYNFTKVRCKDEL